MEGGNTQRKCPSASGARWLVRLVVFVKRKVLEEDEAMKLT